MRDFPPDCFNRQFSFWGGIPKLFVEQCSLFEGWQRRFQLFYLCLFWKVFFLSTVLVCWKKSRETSWFPTWGPVPLVLRHDACANEWIDGMLLGSNGTTFLGRNHLGKSPPIHVGFSRGFVPPKMPGFLLNYSFFAQNHWTQLGGDVSKSHPKKGGGFEIYRNWKGAIHWTEVWFAWMRSSSLSFLVTDVGSMVQRVLVKLSCLDLLGEHVI